MDFCWPSAECIGGIVTCCFSCGVCLVVHPTVSGVGVGNRIDSGVGVLDKLDSGVQVGKDTVGPRALSHFPSLARRFPEDAEGVKT